MKTSRTAGTVVLFCPPDSVSKNIESYLAQIELLYVFDNSPSHSQELIATIRQLPKVKYFTKAQNVGIAGALNIATKCAIDDGFDYLLTMDQDSIAPEGMVQGMISYFDDDPMLAMVTPFHQDRHAPKPLPNVEVEPIVVAMTSGSMLRLSAFQAVGDFMEKLFIDFVDTEYCLRLYTKGYHILRANSVVLSHSLGNFTSKRFLGRTVYPYNHSPIRLYYQSRNRFFLRRLYGKAFPEYFRQDLGMFFGAIVKILLFEDQSCQKLSMIVRGLVAMWRNDFTILPIPADHSS